MRSDRRSRKRASVTTTPAHAALESTEHGQQDIGTGALATGDACERRSANYTTLKYTTLKYTTLEYTTLELHDAQVRRRSRERAVLQDHRADAARFAMRRRYLRRRIRRRLVPPGQQIGQWPAPRYL
jgi:hypothetical protein